MTRHCREDSLSNREFELLMEGAGRIDCELQRLEAQYIVMLCGRLGLRAGEVCHMREDWVDFRRQTITIPRHQPCTKGRHGDEPCGYCRKSARQKRDVADDLSFEDALARSWEPKTPNAARTIPYDTVPRAGIYIERFFDRFDEFQQSRVVVNRRVKRAARNADRLDPENLYPHALRSTAANWYVGKGLDIFALKSMMGWARLSTAEVYMTESGERTQRAVRKVMG